MKWVTRARPKIDRIACPWLIARHIDAQAEFLYVPTEQAVILRGADTDRHELAPQCAGLLAISLGLSHSFADDHEMLRHGMVMYDASYAWCRHVRAERHHWVG